MTCKRRLSVEQQKMKAEKRSTNEIWQRNDWNEKFARQKKVELNGNQRGKAFEAWRIEMSAKRCE
jgi:hypothetical protein